MNKIYEGYLEIKAGDKTDYSELEKVTGDLYIRANAELPNLTSVGGYLYIHANAELKAPKLASVKKNILIHSKISPSLEKQLWKNNQEHKSKRWQITNLASDWLIMRVATLRNSSFSINGFEFDYDLFNRARKDKLSAKEVFSIENTEQRRVAYELMDKKKMLGLDDYKVLDQRKKDERDNPDKIISFNVNGFDKSFLFYNCLCPSTGREYFLQTKKETCKEAKGASFGLTNVEWIKEW